MESYEKKYKNALEWARQVINGETGFIRKEVEEVFPELAESEDEKIRKELIEHIKANKWADYVLFQKFSPDDVIAWLEKQESVEEIVERCKDSWYNKGKIAGRAEGLSDDEKYQQGWHDAIEKQGKQNSAWSNGYSNGYIQAVEKAVEWLKNHNDYIDVKDGNVTYFDMEKCVEDFGKYMEGGEE